MSKPFATDILKLPLTIFRDGTVDPSVGAGIVAPVGSLYLKAVGGEAWIKTGAPNTSWTMLSVGGSTVNQQAFRYVATGAEITPSDFFVPLPLARANDLYLISSTLASVASDMGMSFPNTLAGDRTTTQFRMILTADCVVGDTFEFFVQDPV